MIFTDAEERQQRELMAELEREPSKNFRKRQVFARLYGASHTKRLEMTDA